MRVIPSIEEHCAFVRDISGLREEAEVETADAKDDWEFERVVSVDEVAVSGVRDKLEEVRYLCKDGGEAVATSVEGVFELSRSVLKTSCDNAELRNRITDLERKLKDVRSIKRLACVILSVASRPIKIFGLQAKETDTKHVEVAEKTVKTEENFPIRITSIESPLKAERDPASDVGGHKDVYADRLKEHDTLFASYERETGFCARRVRF